ncbi:MAG TPA: leucyl aminopeptidase, partial [Cobetia sp.]|nr:leucyl aminopeptidase [Cobetia sp.]
MEFPVVTANPAQLETACIVVPVIEGDLTGAAARLDDASEKLISQLIERGDFKPELSNTLLVPFAPGLGAQRLLLAGFGSEEKLDESRYKRGLDAAMTALLKLPIEDAAFAGLELNLELREADWMARMIAESALRTAYRFTEMKSKPGEPVSLTRLSVVSADKQRQAELEAGLRVGAAIGMGVNEARTLGNLPGNICTPRYLGERAEQLGAASDGALKVTVLGEEELEELGALSLLSVGRGSEEPSRLIVMEYRGAEDENEAPHVLVGKGITFDTGGISLKPGAGMDEMKYDMGGAASVFGTMRTVLELKPKLNVVAIVASAENMPDGRATKPGDIIKTLKGLTVEVLNTDAEGRLVLCDALTYAERFEPASVVDIATLTGACVIALGNHATGLISNDDDLALDLLDAG